MRRAGANVLTAAGALVLGSACATGGPTDEPSFRRDEILFGTPDTAHPSVVVLKVVDGGGDTYRCTGVVIAPRLVLTAGHCLEGVVSGKVGFGPLDDATATWTDVTEFVTHPQWRASSGGHPTQNDLALVKIASQPEGIAAARLLPAALAIQQSDVGAVSIEFVGYGRTETGGGGTRLRSSAPLQYACLAAAECTWWRNVLAFAYVAPAAFCHPRANAGTCKGDSGGPAFITRDGQEFVAGISSFGDTACKTHGCHAGIDHAFLDPYIAAARPASGCTTAATCGNHDPCDGEERCVDGQCVAGTPLSCDDGAPCTVDTCVAGTGCSHAPRICEGGSCSTCDPARGCVPARDGTVCGECRVCRMGLCTDDSSCGEPDDDAGAVAPAEGADAGAGLNPSTSAPGGCGVAGTRGGAFAPLLALAVGLLRRRRR